MLTLKDFEASASEILSQTIEDYVNGGAGGEITLGVNTQSMLSYFLKPRVLSGRGLPDCATVLQHRNVDLPIGIAPTAYHRLVHPQGEVGTCLAAKNANTIHILSCLSTTSLSTLGRMTSLDHVWLQLLTFKDRLVMEAMIRQAHEMKCQAIVLTVDAPIFGNRKRDRKNHFFLPSHLRMAILQEHGLLSNDEDCEKWNLDQFFNHYIDPCFSWDDLLHLTQSTDLAVIVKGILRLDDAKKAIDHGAKGIIISNHGGRQLDGTIPSLYALAEIAPALKTQVDLYIDGGFRSGVDVFKALALGAKAVFLGRPILWGLAHDGQQGVEAVLSLFKNELIHTLQLCGVSRLSDIESDMLCQP